MIHLSPAAISEIRRLQLKQQPKTLLRLTIKLGGCSGWFYDISFDQTVKVDDRLFNVNGIEVVIDDHSYSYVHELALDYSEDLMGGGFRFHNPQAIATCGCGNSFSIATANSV
ncbi:iron-sulfur cluster assembly accessory protein [Nodularia harveyana UHCC-0300]|uniref:Iron-sulfur cluster assembly accessory protein n=1 Tax=Nodularia harveyana UHCC-0300 TaxID=2974287 RepID=A0ABU5UFG8_9CYAN|nr:iron-sulfur cluster assembly accessory protein [Nodularia harveyana]MEA5582299.1 iron-sulfur cluster assembly accessory protein [Nodularia harveyana UHCC-0300]